MGLLTNGNRAMLLQYAVLTALAAGAIVFSTLVREARRANQIQSAAREEAVKALLESNSKVARQLISHDSIALSVQLEILSAVKQMERRGPRE